MDTAGPCILLISYGILGYDVLLIGINGAYDGCILISDEVKSDAREAIAGLKNLGIKGLFLSLGALGLTGMWLAGAEKITVQHKKGHIAVFCNMPILIIS